MSGEGLAGYAGILLCMLATGHIETAAHEGGHWLAGRLVGIPTRELRIGGGREVCARRIGATLVTFGWGPWRGYVSPYLHFPVATWREVLFSAGGSMASLLVALAAAVLLWAGPDWDDVIRTILAAVLANALGGVAQVLPSLPFVRSRRSDYRGIRDALRARGREDAWEAWARREYLSRVVERYPVPGDAAPSRLAPVDFHALGVGPPDRTLARLPTAGQEPVASFTFQRWLLSRRGLSVPERAALLDAVATAALLGEVTAAPRQLDAWTAELVALAPDLPTARATRDSALVLLGRLEGRALLERDLGDGPASHDGALRRVFIARAMLDEGDRGGAASMLARAEADLGVVGLAAGFPLLARLRENLATPPIPGAIPG